VRSRRAGHAATRPLKRGVRGTHDSVPFQAPPDGSCSMIAILTAYADLIDGARSYYARRERDDRSAAYAAVSLFSTLLIANVSAATILIDQLLHGGRYTLAPWVSANRLLIVLFAVLVVALHWLLAKRAGVYDRRGPARTSVWTRRLRIYVWVTAFTFLVPVTIAILQRLQYQSG
jgi:hypothetical protein